MNKEELNITNETKKKSHFWNKVSVIILFIALVLIFVVFTNNQHTNIKDESSLTTQVSITDQSFVPATIQINHGNSVKWTNNGSTVHIVASDPYPTHKSLPELVSNPLHSGDSYYFTFSKVGTFTYHDDKNPFSLHGTVIVK